MASRLKAIMRPTRWSLRVAILSALAMIAFAANSIIARLALGNRGIDPGTFTLLRLSSGAFSLILIVHFSATRNRRKLEVLGSWTSATLLLVYAATFSYAYISLSAATGALLLFAVVQTVMLSVALRSGERPGLTRIAGLALALTGLIALVGPGISRPSPIGAFLMSIAGVAWAGYTLRGRGSDRPVLVTAGNFLRSIPLALPLWLLFLLLNREAVHVDARGVGLALLSGAVTSGLGYALWYKVLPSLSRSQSGVIQMAPAPLATVGGLILLGEPLTTQLLLASFLVLSGVLIGVMGRQPKLLE